MDDFRKKISWGFAFFAAATLLSCSKDDIPIPACLTGDCDARMIFPTSNDSNGYYHVKLDWSREYLNFLNIYFLLLLLTDSYNLVYLLHVRYEMDVIC